MRFNAEAFEAWLEAELDRLDAESNAAETLEEANKCDSEFIALVRVKMAYEQAFRS